MPDRPDPQKAVERLSKKAVFVGIPREKNARPGDAIGNAALAYIHENGSPAQNIPARPFMGPGVRDAMPDIEKYMTQAANAALDGDDSAVDAALARVGLTAVNSIQTKIQDGIPPLLKPSSIRRSKTKSRRSGTPGDVTPLYDTGNMLKSISYAIKKA